MPPHKILVPPLPSGSDFTDIAISGVTGWGRGAACPPETSDREISADLPRKRRQGKKEKGQKLRRKEGKVKGKGKIENGRWKSYKMSRGPFFFFFFFLCFLLFKTTKIC